MIRNKINQTIVWGIFIALFIYLLMRSIWLPMQHDEVATFYFYVQRGIFLPPNAHWDANNHLLNSFATFVSYKLFGDDPWALRLPNILSFVLYFWSVWGISKLLKHKLVQWAFLLSLLMAHYLFEYFGQTRGYGMSMAFLMFAIWCSIQYLQKQKFGLFLVIVFSLFLAASANLTLIIPSFILIFYLIIAQFFGIGKKVLFQAIVSLSTTVILFLPLFSFSLALKERGALYYGGKSGFWDYTGNTLLLYFTGYYNSWMAITLTTMFIVLLVSSLYFLIRINNLKLLIKYNSFIFLWLFVGAIASIFAVRYILDVNFPEDRAAIYLFPFFIGSIGFLINDFSLFVNKNYSLLVLPLFFFPVHFISKMNTSTTIFPMDENTPKEYFERVKNSNVTLEGYPATVGGYHMQRLCWSYLNYQSGGKQNEMLVSNFIDTLSDFQIISTSNKLPTNFNRLYKRINPQVLNKLNLYQRINPVQTSIVFSIDSLTNWNHSNQEFLDLATFEVPDFLRGKSYFIGIKGTIDAHFDPFVAAIVISQIDDKGDEITQETINLHWLKYKWKVNENNLFQGKIIPVKTRNVAQIKVYIWNILNNPYLLRNTKVELFSIK